MSHNTALIRSLLLLRNEGRTGVLSIAAEDGPTFLYLRKGVPVFAEEGSHGETLGRLLVRQNVLTQEQYVTIIGNMTDALVLNEQIRFGELAVELGFLTERQVNKALVDQIRWKMIRVFQRRNVSWNFEDSESRVDEVGSFPVRIEAVVLEAIRWMDDDVKNELGLAAARSRLARAEDVPDLATRFELTEAETVFVRSLDGRTIEASLSTKAAMEIDGPAIVTALLVTRAIQLTDEPRLARPATPVVEIRPQGAPASSRATPQAKPFAPAQESPRASSPEFSRAPAQESPRASSPGSSRASSPGSSRASSPEFSRASSPEFSRASSPGSSRASSPEFSRASANPEEPVQLAVSKDPVRAPGGQTRPQAPPASTRAVPVAAPVSVGQATPQAPPASTRAVPVAAPVSAGQATPQSPPVSTRASPAAAAQATPQSPPVSAVPAQSLPPASVVQPVTPQTPPLSIRSAQPSTPDDEPPPSSSTGLGGSGVPSRRPAVARASAILQLLEAQRVKPDAQRAPTSEHEGKLLAEAAFQEALAHHKAGRHTEAAPGFTRASQLLPQSHEYRVYAKWTALRVRKEPPHPVERAELRRLAHAALKADPVFAFGNFVAGVLAIEDGEVMAAQRFLERALKRDKENVEAQRYLRIAERRIKEKK